MQTLVQRASLGDTYALPPRPEFRTVRLTYGRNRRGLGVVSPTTSQIVQLTSQAGTAVAGATLAAPVASMLGIATTAAIPIIGAGIAALSFGIMAILNSGCGQSCIITSNWANQAEALLQQNIAAYFNLPTPRPLSAQQAALANFDAVWNYLRQECSNPQLGTPGQNCIGDRQAGACKWKQPASSVPPWGTPPAGACWNWFNGYRDPIANDPNVYNDGGAQAISSTSSASQAVSNVASDITTSFINPITQTTGLSTGTLALIAAGFLLMLGMGGGK